MATTREIWIDHENNAERFWDIARKAPDVPRGLVRLFAPDGPDRIRVSSKEALAILEWCRGIPGWADGPAYAPNPVRIEEV